MTDERRIEDDDIFQLKHVLPIS